MAGNYVKQWFDQAYEHMSLGEFASAAKCFEEVIKHSGDPYASLIAEQRIKWYCVPLESILGEIEESETPVDVHEVLADLFLETSEYLESEQKTIIQNVETELAKLSSVIRVGNKVWVKEEILNNLLENLAQAIQQSPKLLSISTWLRDQFHDCRPLDYFPDQITLDVFGSGLHEYPIVIFAHEYALSKIALATRMDSLVAHIRGVGRPVLSNTLIEILFPEESEEVAARIVHSLKGQLDSRFIEMTQGTVFLTELLNLNIDPLQDIFLSFPKPLTIENIVCHRFFPSQAIDGLTQRFQSIIERQLAHNPYLRQIGQSDKWISKELEKDLYTQAEAYLLKEAAACTSQNIINEIWLTDSIDFLSRNLLITLLNDALKLSQNVVMVGNQTWIHLEVLERLVDKCYKQLLLSPAPLATDELLTSNLHLGNISLTRNLINNFENLMLKDSRFISESNRLPHRWRAVDPMKRDNHLALQVLKHAHKLLTQAEIASLLITQQGISTSSFELMSDDRFKAFPPDRWGLKEWVSINDLAYTYLLASHQALHEVVIIGLICKDNHIKRENAIFTPLEDPRFSQDSINRWFCRHSLSPAELDRLHEELIKYGGSGRKLDILIRQVLYKDANATDAAIKLKADKRFIFLDNLWFSREASFQALKPADLEKLYNTLVSQLNTRHSVSIKELVYQAIGHDGRLTDANEWLNNDARFLRVHEEFWTLRDAPKLDFDRSSIRGVPVFQRNDEEDLNTNDAGIEDRKLTPRKPRSKMIEMTSEDRRKEHKTLTHLDILHGNLRIAKRLKHWIARSATNIHCRDEEGYEFIAYIDETRSILNIREWLEKRGLTYGDKILIQPVPQTDELLFQPYGVRDERVYQEALGHQEIEKLIEEARSVNKSFHDLTIEVMEVFDYPLHREDIYQLVNYHRTANRATISEILSLPDCPFEELRYFTPVGRGYWKFDRKRKEAYDMKMQELMTLNDTLQSQMADLQTQLDYKEESSGLIRSFSEENKVIQQMNAEINSNLEILKKEKNAAEQLIAELKIEVEAQRARVTGLQIKLIDSQAETQQLMHQTDEEKEQLKEDISKLASQLEGIQIQIIAIQKAASLQVKDIQTELGTRTQELETQLKLKNNLETELATLAATNKSLQNDVDQLRAEAVINKIKIDSAVIAVKSNAQNFQEEIERLNRERAEIVAQLDMSLRRVNEDKKCLEKDIEELKRESTARIGQLESELNAANSKVALLEETVSNPTLKLIMQSFSRYIHRKSNRKELKR